MSVLQLVLLPLFVLQMCSTLSNIAVQLPVYVNIHVVSFVQFKCQNCRDLRAFLRVNLVRSFPPCKRFDISQLWNWHPHPKRNQQKNILSLSTAPSSAKLTPNYRTAATRVTRKGWLPHRSKADWIQLLQYCLSVRPFPILIWGPIQGILIYEYNYHYDDDDHWIL